MSHLKLHKTLAMKNTFIQEKLLPWLTCNPGLVLTGFEQPGPEVLLPTLIFIENPVYIKPIVNKILKLGLLHHVDIGVLIAVETLQCRLHSGGNLVQICFSCAHIHGDGKFLLISVL